MFDPRAHYKQAVLRELDYWHDKLLPPGMHVDQWRPSWKEILAAQWEGCLLPEGLISAVKLCVGTFPVIERWGLWFEWQDLIAEMLLRVAGDAPLSFQLLLFRGRIDFLNHNFTDAIKFHKEALAIAERLDDTIARARAAHFWAIDYTWKRDFKKAVRFGQQARGLLADAQEVPRLKADLLNTLGLIATDTNNLSTGIENYLEAAEIYKQLDEPTKYQRVLNNLGNAYFYQKKWEQAKQTFLQAYAVLVPTESVIDSLKALTRLGNAYFINGEYEDAEAVYRRAYAQGEPIAGIYHLRGSLSHNLGNVFIKLGRYVEAERLLQKSFLLWKQAADDLQRANTTGTPAELAASCADWPTAVERYDAALTLRKRFSGHPWAESLSAKYIAAPKKCRAAMKTAEDGEEENDPSTGG